MARPASDISERLVLAARERFLVEGVDGASLRAIARDAETSLGMVYYYFPAKDDLFFAVVEDVYAGLVARLEPTVTGPASTAEKVNEIYQLLGALSDDELKVMRLIVREALVSSARLTRLFERFSRGHLAQLLGMVLQGVQKGELRADVPPLVMAICTVAIGLLPQIVSRRLREAAVPAESLFPAPEALAAILAEVLLHGTAVRHSAELTQGESGRK